MDFVDLNFGGWVPLHRNRVRVSQRQWQIGNLASPPSRPADRRLHPS
jgi:hypothetical protein